MSTWSELKVGVNEMLVEDGHIAGIEIFIDRLMKAGAVNLQRYIPAFKDGNERVIPTASLIDEGEAHSGSLEVGEHPVQVFKVDDVDVDTDEASICNNYELERLAWRFRTELLCGRCTSNGRGYYVYDLQTRTIIIYPKLENQNLVVKFNGLKREFNDLEEVPFEPFDSVVLALYYWVKFHIKRDMDEALMESRDFKDDYYTVRRELKRDNKE